MTENPESRAASPPSNGRGAFAGLNPDQLDAVVHRGGPLLVVAGAGSGKTRVLTHRIAHLIDEGVPPTAILAITFTNKAADEMRRRAAELVGPVTRAMWVSTFHSACVRILRAQADLLGYPRQFSIYDQADATRLTGYVIRDLGLDSKRFTPRGVQGTISLWKNELVDPAAGGGLAPSTSSIASTPRCTPSTSAGCTPPGRWTSTTCSSTPWRCCASIPTFSRPTASASSTSSSTSTRTPTSPRTSSSCCSPAATATSRSSATATSRSTASGGRPAQHRAVRGRLPRRGHDDRPRPELPQHADDPRRRQRRHRQQHRPQAEAPLDGRRAG